MVEYTSSERDFQSFITSSVWRDMQKELNVWLDEIRNALEDIGAEETPKSTEKLRGAAKAIRRVLAMPEAIMENIIADKEREKDELRREQASGPDELSE